MKQQPIMQNHRHITNPAKQNQHLYTLTSFSQGFDGRHCDYYLPFGVMNRNKNKHEFFVISKEPPVPMRVFTGITIKDPKAEQIILSVDWNKYKFEGMFAYMITHADFHRGYNDAK